MNFPNITKINLYDENSTTITGVETSLNKQPGSILLEIDLSGKKQSLLELVQRVRSITDRHPDDVEITIYFVAGSKINKNSWSAFVEYLCTLPNPMAIVYRGYIHPETLKILTNFNIVTLDNDVKFVYLADKVNLMMKTLAQSPDMFRKFLERWISKYHEIEVAEFGINELREIGFVFNVINEN